MPGKASASKPAWKPAGSKAANSKATTPKKPATRRASKSNQAEDTADSPAETPAAQVTAKVKTTHLRYTAKREIRFKPDADAEIKQLNEDWREHVSTHDIRQDETFSNVAKVMTLLANYEIQTLVEVTRPGDVERTIESLLNTPPLAQRNITSLKQIQAGKDSWRVRYNLNERGPYFITTGSKHLGDMVPFGLVAAKDRKTMEKVAKELIKIHNIWPYPDTDATTRSAFAAIAVKRATGVDRKLVIQPTYAKPTKTSPFPSLLTQIRFIDSDTGLTKTTAMTIKTNVVKDCLPVPDLPSNSVLYRPAASKGVEVLKKDKDGKWPSCKDAKTPLPKELSKATFDKCERFMRYSAEKMTGLVTKIERIEDLFNLHKTKFGIPTTHSRGVFGNQKLFYVLKLAGARRGYEICLSDHAARSVGLGVNESPRVIVRSLEAPRLVQVLDAGLAAFMLKPDPRWALWACAKMADQVNMDIQQGMPAEASCGCTSEEKQTNLHHCARCITVTPCQLLRYNLDGVRVCDSCIEKDMPRHNNVVENMIRQSLQRSFAREGAANNLDPEAEQPMRDEAVTEMLNTLPPRTDGPAYNDTYNAGELVRIATEFADSRDPDQPVVDAVYPRVLTKNKQIRRHAPQNLVLTRDPTNRGKWDQIPGFVQVIGGWLDASPEERFYNDALELMKTTIEMQQVRLKRSQHFRLETEGLYTIEQLRREKAEYLCGKPCPDDLHLWEAHSERFVQRNIPSLDMGYTWTDTQRANFVKLTAQYEKDFGVTLGKSEDGCPYVGLDGTMEPLYNWNGAALLCQERLERMILKCNRRHATIDTEYTLFAELIRSACVMMACLQGKCPDSQSHGPSHLPICLRIRHGLRFAIAHRHHGQQMRTGWQVDEPSDKSQRDDSQSNILVEACTTNWMKWDYLEKYYQVIHDNFARADVPTEWYDPRTNPPSGPGPEVTESDFSVDADDNESYPAVLDSACGTTDDDAAGEGQIGGSGQVEGAQGGAQGEGSQGGAQGGAQGAESQEETPGAGVQSGAAQGGEANLDTPAWHLIKKNYASAAAKANDLVPPNHDAYGLVLVVGGEEGYARTDHTFRPLQGSKILGTVIDGEVGVMVTNIASYVPEP